MSVDLITEKWSSRDGSKESGEDGKSGRRSKRRVFEVTVTNSTSDNINDVYIALYNLGVRLGGQHPLDFFMRCRRMSDRQVTPFMYEVTAEYEAKGKDDEENPLNAAPIIEWGPLREEEEIDTDADGVPILTASREPYDPPIRIPVASRTLAITRNLPVFLEGVANYFENTVNSAPFAGWPAGTGLCTGISGRSVETEELIYWTVTGNFHFRKGRPGSDDSKAWYKRVLHQGYYLWLEVAGAFQPVRIMDSLDAPKTKPSLLNADASEIITNPNDAVWKEYKVFGSADFNEMGLL